MEHEYKDHLGYSYDTITEMCKAWGVNRTSFLYRINKGYTVEQALTGNGIPDTNSNKCIDNSGIAYDSEKAMCRALGVNVSAYYLRKSRGYNVRDALDKKTSAYRNCKECVDHKGNVYESAVEMCNAYGIDTGMFYNRINRDWSLEDALTSKKRKTVNGKICIDHLGNEYKSIKEMCKHHNMDARVFHNRINQGWSIGDALTKDIQRKG